MSRLAVLCLSCCMVLPVHAAEPLRDGDIIFHTSRSGQSLAIQRATHSPLSHVGLVFFRDGKPFVLEAVATVRYTPLAQWTVRGHGAQFDSTLLRTVGP